jgi:hypothetical protein
MNFEFTEHQPISAGAIRRFAEAHLSDRTHQVVHDPTFEE